MWELWRIQFTRKTHHRMHTGRLTEMLVHNRGDFLTTSGYRASANCPKLHLGGLGWILRRLSSWRGLLSIGMGYQGSGGISHPWRYLRDEWACTKGQGLLMGLSKSGWWLSFMILKGFPNLNHSMIIQAILSPSVGDTSRAICCHCNRNQPSSGGCSAWAVIYMLQNSSQNIQKTKTKDNFAVPRTSNSNYQWGIIALNHLLSILRVSHRSSQVPLLNLSKVTSCLL